MQVLVAHQSYDVPQHLHMPVAIWTFCIHTIQKSDLCLSVSHMQMHIV